MVFAIAHLSPICCHPNEVDISLENMLLTSDRKHAKLIDFGAAREFKRGEVGEVIKFSVKEDGSPGKRSYMAPEIFAQEDFDGTKADTYSMGVVLFLLVVGKSPYKYPSYSDPFFRFLMKNGIGRLLAHFNCRLNEDLLSLLDSTVAKVAEDRFGIDEILHHKWLTSPSGISVSIDSSRGR